jgi:hypothetical protein
MTKDELIAKQQIQIEEQKERISETNRLRKLLISRFCSIGAPLNDNVLQFNKEQIKWLQEIEDIIQHI